MATKKTTTRKQAITIHVALPGAGAPTHLLANAELHFTTGLLAGLRLTGIALWAAKSGEGRRFVSVTFPTRAVEDADGVRYYDHVRGKGEDVKRLKAAIVAAYRAFAQAEGIEVPEDETAAAAA